WRQTRRSASRALGHVRTCHQYVDCQGARPGGTADATRPRRRGDGMKRRAFITLLGGAAAAWPLVARAKQTTKSRKVGLLHPGESTVVNMRVAAIREGLNGPDNQRDMSFEIIVRLADGDVSRLPALAMDLVNNRVDAILAAAPRAV